MKFIMKIEGTAFASRPEHMPELYLEWFRPENRKRFLPMICFTEDRDKAQKFDTMEALMELWRTPIGTRPDGRPDRPLTAFTISTLATEVSNEQA